MSVVLCVASLVAAVALAMAVARRRPPAAVSSRRWPIPEELRATARTIARWRLAGLAVGLAAAVTVAQHGTLGRGLSTAAPVAALGVLTGVVVGELRGTRPRGAVRSAPLEVRRVRDYLPAGLARWVAGATAALAALLVTTTATGSADDLGRPGRELVLRCNAAVTHGAGPWPGSYYAVPAAVLVVAGLAGAGVAMLRIVRRPRPGGDPRADDALRRASAEAVTAAAGLLVAVPLGGMSAVAGAALRSVDCGSGMPSTGGLLLLTVAVGALVLASWCAGLLVRPARWFLAAEARVAAER